LPNFLFNKKFDSLNAKDEVDRVIEDLNLLAQIPKMNNYQQNTDLTSFSVFRNRLHVVKALP